MIEKTNNKRYKQLNYNGKNILLDMDSNKLTWIFPFLVWFFPVKGYVGEVLPIKKEEKKKQSSGIILSSSVLSIILIKMTNNGFGDFSLVDNYQIKLLILLISSMLLILFIRYFFRYKKNEIPLTNQDIVYIKFDFNNGIWGKMEYVRTTFLLTLSCYGIVLFFTHVLINSYPNVIILPLILLVEYFLLIINTTILHPQKNCKLIVNKNGKIM